LVTFDILIDLFFPEILVYPGPLELPAIMFMPETAMHKHCLSLPLENNIGSARQVFSMEPVFVSLRPQPFANYQFRFGVLAFYPGHVAAELFR